MAQEHRESSTHTYLNPFSTMIYGTATLEQGCVRHSSGRISAQEVKFSPDSRDCYSRAAIPEIAPSGKHQLQLKESPLHVSVLSSQNSQHSSDGRYQQCYPMAETEVRTPLCVVQEPTVPLAQGMRSTGHSSCTEPSRTRQGWPRPLPCMTKLQGLLMATSGHIWPSRAQLGAPSWTGPQEKEAAVP